MFSSCMLVCNCHPTGDERVYENGECNDMVVVIIVNVSSMLNALCCLTVIYADKGLSRSEGCLDQRVF